MSIISNPMCITQFPNFKEKICRKEWIEEEEKNWKSLGEKKNNSLCEAQLWKEEGAGKDLL
jgi:hypothetical protein